MKRHFIYTLLFFLSGLEHVDFPLRYNYKFSDTKARTDACLSGCDLVTAWAWWARK